jgi:hypothetical protein
MVLGGHAGCAFADERSVAEDRLKERVARDGGDPERMVVDWNGPRPPGIDSSVDQVVAKAKRTEDQSR